MTTREIDILPQPSTPVAARSQWLYRLSHEVHHGSQSNPDMHYGLGIYHRQPQWLI